MFIRMFNFNEILRGGVSFFYSPSIPASTNFSFFFFFYTMEIGHLYNNIFVQ